MQTEHTGRDGQPELIAGRYRVERAVGHGGMGTVWLCRDELLGREVAVKGVGTMPGESTSDVNRALREARSSAALNHPNVVSIFDAVEDDGRNWLVMEYVPSRTLAEIIAQEGPLSPERAAHIGRQAADGLAAAHARGTMHRDVKPGNILVTDDDHVKIMDFGISPTHGDMQLTSTGLITGTPAYFAPEIARGEPADLPADVWALGATLYAAVEGHPPYPEQDNALALLTTIATKSAPLPRRAGHLTEAINRMMDRDPVARWSMVDAAHVLRRLGAGAGAGDPARPERTVALAAGAVGAAGAGVAAAGAAEPAGASGAPAAATGTTDVAEPAEAPGPAGPPGAAAVAATDAASDDGRRRAGWLLPAAVVVLLLALTGVVGALLMTGDDDEPVAAEDTSDTSASPSTEPSPSEDPVETEDTEAEPSPEPVEPEPTEDSEESEPEEEQEQEPAPAGDVEEFASGYYGLLPGDTAAAYELLSPSYGSSYEDYDGFWRTIDGVAVNDVRAVDDTTVDVDLTYTTGGSSENETRRLFLEPAGDGYVIASDSAI